MPEWDECTEEHHVMTRNAIHWWTLHRRPRQHYLPQWGLWAPGARIKYALRFAKRTAETARVDALAIDLDDNYIDGFWKSVKRIN